MEQCITGAHGGRCHCFHHQFPDKKLMQVNSEDISDAGDTSSTTECTVIPKRSMALLIFKLCGPGSPKRTSLALPWGPGSEVVLCTLMSSFDLP